MDQRKDRGEFGQWKHSNPGPVRLLDCDPGFAVQRGSRERPAKQFLYIAISSKSSHLLGPRHLIFVFPTCLRGRTGRLRANTGIRRMSSHKQTRGGRNAPTSANLLTRIFLHRRPSADLRTIERHVCCAGGVADGARDACVAALLPKPSLSVSCSARSCISICQSTIHTLLSVPFMHPLLRPMSQTSSPAAPVVRIRAPFRSCTLLL